MSERLAVRARSSDAGLKTRAEAVEADVWAPLGFLGATEAHSRHYDRLLGEYEDLQLCLVDETNDELLALANCIPARWDKISDLPNEGWDWLVESGGRRFGATGNVLGALAISVPPGQRGQGHAQRMLREMKGLCGRYGFEALIAPVRPSAKCHHVHEPMADYIARIDPLGRCFDPWLRSHYQAGARLLGVCARSMVVDQHVAFWETWAGRPFETSGLHAIDGALAPVRIDLESGFGLYEEPNVWVAYAP
ncbi:transferase [Aureimonas sp. AU12]|uniref:transferase n=1 Tax=Aureimonas sp. AU12 TaxID=1638161 RepID=UPI0009ECC4D5|nr:transferase [Aureimonas sp. AU12]